MRLRRVGQPVLRPLPVPQREDPFVFRSRRSISFSDASAATRKATFSISSMMIEGLTFLEALKKLADQHGIALPKQSLASDEETRLRAALYEMHEIAADHFRSNLAGLERRQRRARISRSAA